MGRLFDLDSPVMRALNKMADLMWLNLLVIFCSLPIVTAGAAFTAAHYVALKMHRNEEGYITREFFKSFKLNFKQSTLIWLMVLLVTAVLGVDYYLFGYKSELRIPDALQVVIMAATVLFLFLLVWVFPLQARFVNSVPRTLKNAMALSILQLPKTILMILLYIIPWLLLLTTMRLLPVVFVFGISAPVYGSTVLYNKVFKKMEDMVLAPDSSEMTEDTETTEEETEGSEDAFSDQSTIEEDEN